MQIVIEVTDAKADFVIELLTSLPYVAIQKEVPKNVVPEIGPLLPKTTQLLGLFPQLANPDMSARQRAILNKHA